MRIRTNLAKKHTDPEANEKRRRRSSIKRDAYAIQATEAIREPGDGVGGELTSRRAHSST